jgi:hypothetical protein
MRKLLLACTASLALLGATGMRASACEFGFSIGFNITLNCWGCCTPCCNPCCDDCYCGWPGYHLDGGYGDEGGYPVADSGYGVPATGYAAPAAAPVPSEPAKPFPPAPKPVDGGKQSSYPGYWPYGTQQAGYVSYGAPSAGYYGATQAPSYWYGR